MSLEACTDMLDTIESIDRFLAARLDTFRLLRGLYSEQREVQLYCIEVMSWVQALRSELERKAEQITEVRSSAG